MSTQPETVDAEVVEPGAEVATVDPAANTTLFRTDDPATVLQRATEVANSLAPVLKERGMLSNISGREYVRVEGWMTLGSMLGVTAVGVWTRKVDNGWEAKVDARTLDGRVIGSAEAMCLSVEDNWKDSDEFAIRSMAQTRAASKALASVLRFVVTLAGFAGTPAEEMAGVKTSGRSGSEGNSSRPASKKQAQWVVGGGGRPSLFDQATLGEGQRKALVRWLSGGDELSSSAASVLIERMKDAPEKGAQELLAEMEAKAAEGDEDAKAAASLLTGDVPADTSDLDADPGPTDDTVPF